MSSPNSPKAGLNIDLRIPQLKPEKKKPFGFADLVPTYNEDELELLSLEQSWADFARGIRTGLRARVSRVGSSQTIAFRAGSLVSVCGLFTYHFERFGKGHKDALVDALRLACEENVVLPYWVADGILSALNDLDENPNVSMHDVFGMHSRYPVSKTRESKRARKSRLDWDTKIRLYTEVSKLIAHKQMPKTEAIRLAIRTLPIEFRTAFRWFNEMKDQQQAMLRARRGTRLHKSR